VNNHRDIAYLESFGKHLKSLRQGKGYTQSLFADKANLERSQIIRLEKGRINPTLSTLKILAETLEITVSNLLDFN
jgi:transcriptional regulator with XRE-family HTH domain